MNIGVFVALILLMSMFGSTQPIHPALGGFVEGCEGVPQPCWNGIVPGITSVKEIKIILLSLKYSPARFNNDSFWGAGDVCNILISSDSRFREAIRLTFCRTLPTIGDVMSIITLQPSSATINYCSREFIISHDRWQLNANGSTVNGSAHDLWLFAPPDEPRLSRWRGFALRWFYEQNLTPRDCM
jgi:hypothetical protein